MHQISQKMRNNSGASMLLTLALLLVCVMVSSVIVASATSGASRNENRTIQQREYLAISSAAQLIQKNLTGIGSVTETSVITRYPCYTYKKYPIEKINGVNAILIPTPSEFTEDVEKFYLVLPSGTNLCGDVKNDTISEEDIKLNGPFAEIMERASKEVFFNHRPYTEEFTMEVTSENGTEERLPEVHCEFRMSTNFNVKVEITSATGESNYAITVSMDANEPIYDDTGIKQEVSCQHSYMYVVLKGNIYDYVMPTEKWTFRHEVTSPATTITWLNPTIEKGVE